MTGGTFLERKLSIYSLLVARNSNIGLRVCGDAQASIVVGRTTKSSMY